MGTRHALRRAVVLAVALGAFSGIQPGVAAALTGTPGNMLHAAPGISPVTLRGDYAAAGTGMFDTGAGEIVIGLPPDTAPPGSTVQSAYLYWAITDDAPEERFKEGMFNGVPITGALVGQDDDPCWDMAGATTTFSYRADVTGLVLPTVNGAYTLSGFATGIAGGLPIDEGASLVILYTTIPGTPERTITIYEGAATVDAAEFRAVTAMTVPRTGTGPSKTTYVVADGQILFPNDQTLFDDAIIANGEFDNAPDGAFWDTETHEVTVPAGTTKVYPGIQRGGEGGDCLVHVAQVFSAPKGSDAGTEEPQLLTITPVTATPTVGGSHTVTATVVTVTGTPVAGVVVQFTVTGAVNTTGTCTTNANGQCTFTFAGPAFPGAVEITATADLDKNGVITPPNEIAVATAEFVLPKNTPDCEIKITTGGWIVTNTTSRGSFGGNAKTDAAGNILIVAGVTGEEEYQDHGLVPQNMHGEPMALVCDPDRKSGTIFGKGTVNGLGSFWFRIKVKDAGEPGTMDMYGMLISNGYWSGDKLLSGGNIQIH